jgi:hypothetical protein
MMPVKAFWKRCLSGYRNRHYQENMRGYTLKPRTSTASCAKRRNIELWVGARVKEFSHGSLQNGESREGVCTQVLEKR